MQRASQSALAVWAANAAHFNWYSGSAVLIAWRLALGALEIMRGESGAIACVAARLGRLQLLLQPVQSARSTQ